MNINNILLSVYCIFGIFEFFFLLVWLKNVDFENKK